jgi:hypothetical protein
MTVRSSMITTAEIGTGSVTFLYEQVERSE